MTVMQRISGGHFLLMGRAGMDFYADPPGAAAEHASSFVAHLGGSSANVAVALARQGLRSALLTTVSDDPVGRFCVNQLQHYGVATDHVRVVTGEARTSLAVAESRLADYRCVIYRNNAADFHIAVEDVEAVDFAAYDAFAFTGTALAAEPSRSAVFRAAERARQSGIPVIMDLDYRAYSWSAPDLAARSCARAAALCDMVVGNDEEFDVLAGGGDARGYDAARTLAATTAAIVIYKMGAKGSVTFHAGQAHRIGVYPVAALKPVGAGDAFLGGVLAALAQQRSLAECVRRGSAAAAIVVARVGCAPAMPTTAELDAFLADPAHRESGVDEATASSPGSGIQI
jgi:5-dehydro-2-deoxygluconokinase